MHGAQKSEQRRGSERCMELLQWREDKETCPVKSRQSMYCVYSPPSTTKTLP